MARMGTLKLRAGSSDLSVDYQVTISGEKFDPLPRSIDYIRLVYYTCSLDGNQKNSGFAVLKMVTMKEATTHRTMYSDPRTQSMVVPLLGSDKLIKKQPARGNWKVLIDTMNVKSNDVRTDQTYLIMTEYIPNVLIGDYVFLLPTVEEIEQVLAQIAAPLVLMRDVNEKNNAYIHKDVVPRNVFVQMDEANNKKYLLGDFGVLFSARTDEDAVDHVIDQLSNFVNELHKHLVNNKHTTLAESVRARFTRKFLERFLG